MPCSNHGWNLGLGCVAAFGLSGHYLPRYKVGRHGRSADTHVLTNVLTNELTS